MSAKFFLTATAFILAPGLTAQTPAVSGSFVSTLGSDTIQIERFTRTRDKLEGDIARKSPRVQVVHYVADLSGGKFKGMSTTARRYDADPATPPMISIVALIADTTANVEVQRNGKADSASSGTRSFKGRSAATVPGSPPAIGVYEQILASNPPVGKDSIVVNLIGAAATKSTLTMVRRSRDSVVFISSFFPGWVEMATTDGSGRIQALDAAATTVKAVTRRAPNLDFDAVTKSWAASEAAHGPAGQMSPPDTVRATVGAANVEIAYSRPFKRGRTIFGSNIVPWNVVWRTGANAATQLTTSADLMIGNTAVPAGRYTLWTLPTPTGAKLIINSQTGQWGTDYDMSKDFARVDVAQTILTKPVEEFTFAIVPQGTGAVLKYSWDDREYSVPIRVK
jgi:hypothetical protein